VVTVRQLLAVRGHRQHHRRQGRRRPHCPGLGLGPFGHRNILWELNVADLWNQAQPTPLFTDQELAQLVTTNPGHALTEVWPQPVGTIQAGALADLIVMRRRLPDPYRNLIQATETTSASS
jgi:5-methylthioadenosine/S-adenosylhomocysteine deaminase